MLTFHAPSPRPGTRTQRAYGVSRASWRARRSLALLAAACTPLWSLSACNDDLARVYTGRSYQADPGCLDSYVPIAVVYAERLRAACEPTCLLQDDQLYVSTLCAPYPERAELIASEEDADCAAALEAFALDLSCEAEPASVDAGASADAGANADAAAIAADAGEEPSALDAAAPDGG